MLIRQVDCPHCGGSLIIERKLWATGGARLRCPSCQRYFAPEGSPGDISLAEASMASVTIELWEPSDAT